MKDVKKQEIFIKFYIRDFLGEKMVDSHRKIVGLILLIPIISYTNIYTQTHTHTYTHAHTYTGIDSPFSHRQLLVVGQTCETLTPGHNLLHHCTCRIKYCVTHHYQEVQCMNHHMDRALCLLHIRISSLYNM